MKKDLGTVEIVISFPPWIRFCSPTLHSVTVIPVCLQRRIQLLQIPVRCRLVRALSSRACEGSVVGLSAPLHWR